MRLTRHAPSAAKAQLGLHLPAVRAAALFATTCLILACAAASRNRPAPDGPGTLPAPLPPSSEANEPLENVTEQEAEPGIDVEDAGAPPARVYAVEGTFTCTSSRPRLCDSTPSPVCARREGATQNADAGPELNADYINGCLACSDPSVRSYVRGRCAYRGATPLAPSSPGRR